jgi:uncharacterized membrane protein YhaH (DUF805 family)
MSELNTTPPQIDAAERFSLKVRERTAQLLWLMFSFKGRIGRLGYLLALFLLYGVPLLLYFLISALAESGLATIATPLSFKGFEESAPYAVLPAVVVFCWINFAVVFKRLHDFGCSLGTCILLALFGLIGLILLFWPGHPHANEYGPGSGWKNRPM